MKQTDISLAENLKYPVVAQKALEWHESFKKKNGRSLRVLHIGNVANNAYLNAKLLRSVGIEADVIARDDFYMMGSPEWEEVNISDYRGSDFFPVFSKLDLKDYKKPSWFIQGPSLLCLLYLNAKFDNKEMKCKFYRFLTKLSGRSIIWFYSVSILSYLLLGGITVFLNQLTRKIKKLFKNYSNPFRFNLSKLSKKNGKKKYFLQLVEDFNINFPHRQGKMVLNDLLEFGIDEKFWKKTFSQYDIVQGYGIDPIWSLISDSHPFVAFEHGTLRDFTMGNEPLHRVNALAYHKADYVFITNGDCLSFAKKLGIQRYSGIPHPIEAPNLEPHYKKSRELRSSFDTEIILFCPIRHDWSVKSPEIHLEAFSKICHRINRKIKLILCAWGRDISKSQDTIKKYNINDNIVWLKPLCRKKLIEHMLASDIILDQMMLPHFGGITSQAIALGIPVIMSYKPESSAWIFPEPPPIISAFSSEDVVNAVIKVLNNDGYEKHKQQSIKWFNDYHHPNIVVNKHLEVYEKLLSKPS